MFSKCEEERLSNYCIQMADIFGLLIEDVMRSAFLLAEKSSLKHPFKNGKAGLRDFCKEIHSFLFIKHNLFQWLEQQVLIKRL